MNPTKVAESVIEWDKNTAATEGSFKNQQTNRRFLLTVILNQKTYGVIADQGSGIIEGSFSIISDYSEEMVVDGLMAGTIIRSENGWALNLNAISIHAESRFQRFHCISMNDMAPGISLEELATLVESHISTNHALFL